LFQNLFGFQFDLPEFAAGIVLGFVVLLAFNRGLPLVKQSFTWGRGQVGQVSVSMAVGARDPQQIARLHGKSQAGKERTLAPDTLKIDSREHVQSAPESD